MELLSHLALGFETALSPLNLFYCFAGVLIGTLIGVLPGLGPAPTVAMLLPLSFGLPPVSGFIMLSGIFYGAQYGGSTTAILINTPGESSSVVTALDGYQMARKGRAGEALAMAAMGSFIAGTIATIIIALLAPPLAKAALLFGPADYFSLMVLGLIAAIALASGSVVKAVAMAVLGLLLGLVGTDVTSGVQRYTFGALNLFDGIAIVALAMGLFSVAEVLRNLEGRPEQSATVAQISGLAAGLSRLRPALGSILRGTAIGSVLGIVFSFNNSMFDVWMLLLFSFVGYILVKLRCEPAPMLLGFILGPMMEEHLRRALLLSRGNAAVFIERPISAAMLAIALLLILAPALSVIRARREQIFVED